MKQVFNKGLLVKSLTDINLSLDSNTEKVYESFISEFEITPTKDNLSNLFKKFGLFINSQFEFNKIYEYLITWCINTASWFEDTWQFGMDLMSNKIIIHTKKYSVIIQ